ncbi:MAG: ribosome biogenesis GTP-binding protein YihA/YsxC [Parachlamydiales bacterium]|jgi:GTP-binding protein
MKAVFLASAYNDQQLPKLNYPKIILAGRSNVGKSSLINHLFQNPKLAKVAKTPGKTRSLNFYLIDETLLLVDLPGYGFARISKSIKESWGRFINFFLETSASEHFFLPPGSIEKPPLLLFLIDARRDLNADDLALLDWAKNKKLALILVFTKCDKTRPKSEIKEQIQHRLGALLLEVIEYSIKEKRGREKLLFALQQIKKSLKLP